MIAIFQQNRLSKHIFIPRKGHNQEESPTKATAINNVRMTRNDIKEQRSYKNLNEENEQKCRLGMRTTYRKTDSVRAA